MSSIDWTVTTEKFKPGQTVFHIFDVYAEQPMIVVASDCISTTVLVDGVEGRQLTDNLATKRVLPNGERG